MRRRLHKNKLYDFARRTKNILGLRKRKCVVSIGDVFLRRSSSITETQFISTSRYLDIRRYCEDGIADFPYKNLFCETFFGRHHNSQKSNADFAKLINSFASKGFSSRFPIVLNGNDDLIDGNHRCGACLYFKINEFYARVNKYGQRVEHDIDKFINNKIPIDFVETILKEYDKIQEWLIDSGNTFALVAFGFSDEKEIVDFLKKVSFLCTILNTIKVSKSVLVQFCVTTPQYNIINEHLVSMRCIEIEKKLKRTTNGINLVISKSCYEGYHIVRDFKSKQVKDTNTEIP